MLNQTTGKQVHQIIKELFRKYPTPQKMAEANPNYICSIIKSCGLYNKRSLALIRFSQEYLEKDWMEPKELFAIGKYGQDSFDIFIRGKRVKPDDKELKKYIKWKYSKSITKSKPTKGSKK
jgi:methyl-CpG-binding domain protein 4